MKAIVFEEHGGVEKLQYKEISDPKVGPNEVLFKIRAAGCNYNDIWARRGLPGMEIIMPHVSGSDASGEVVEIGSEVQSVKPGDDVMVHPGISCRSCEACTSGQEFFCRRYRIWASRPVPGRSGRRVWQASRGQLDSQARKHHIPGGCDPAAHPNDRLADARDAGSHPGRRLCPYMGRGGGTRVHGDTGMQPVWGQGNCSGRVRREGGIRQEPRRIRHDQRKTQKVRDEVRRITNRAGVDIVFEHTGEQTWKDSVGALKRGGSLVTCGATSGFIGQTDIRFLWNKQMNFYGSHMASKGEFLQGMKFVETGEIKPLPSQAVPLKDAAIAQKTIEDGDVMGKMILIPDHA